MALVLLTSLSGCGGSDKVTTQGSGGAGQSSGTGSVTGGSAGGGGSTPAPASCGNQVTEQGEACDGSDLTGMTCSTVYAGFKGGTLHCQSSCTGFDVSQCVAGNTVTAASCSASDVQKAIHQAVNGTTVMIPAGSCTWSTPVTLDVTTKSIALKGAGNTKTNIAAAVESALDIHTAEGQTADVSDLHFTDGTGNDVIIVAGSAKSFRIHDLAFDTHGVSTDIIRTEGATYGVIDHCTFSGDTPSEVLNTNDTNWTSYQRPLEWGTALSVYIEDVTVKFSGQWEGRPFDGEFGGRMVIRHNHSTNQVVIVHGFDSGACASMLELEVYDNQFVIDDFDKAWGGNETWDRLMLFRGGTGVVFDNKFTVADDIWLGGGTTTGLSLAIFRSTEAVQQGFPNSSWPLCDGTPYKLCSNVDKGWNVTSGDNPIACASDGDCGGGLTCKWRFCSTSKTTLCTADGDCPSGEACTAFLDGPVSTKGYPCFMQPGFGTDMTHAPLYAWGNTLDGSQNFQAKNMDLHFLPEDGRIIKGRDFLDDEKPHRYVPYVYPHPLVQVGK